MPDDRILGRVRKLLAKAEHPSTPPAEAEALSERAAELMARYAIDLALVEQRADTREQPTARKIRVVAPYAMPKAVLLTQVATAYRVRTVIQGSGDSEGRLCTLVGYPGDLETSELLFTSLLLQATTAMLAASEGQRRVRAFRHAFLLGYAATIGDRLARAQRRVVEEVVRDRAPSAELVLADRAAVVDRTVAELFPRMRGLRATASHGGGIVAGRAAGARADVSAGDRRVGGAHPALG